MTTQLDNPTDLTDHFLIATPDLRNSYFDTSLIYVCRHNHEGAFGIVINKPTPFETNSLFEKTGHKPPSLSKGNRYIYFGGPVNPNQVFVLHRPKMEVANHFEVESTDMAITSSTEILEKMAEGSCPSQILFAIGYAGWEANQLEEEISRNSWIIAKADRKILFDVSDQEKLTHATRSLGFEWHSISERSGCA